MQNPENDATDHPEPLVPTFLHYFSQPAILQQIGVRRLGKFLDGFSDDVQAANILLPDPESENGDYFNLLAAAIGASVLPARLRAALLTLETAASPENQDRLDSTIQRRIPCVSLSNYPVDRALELWFLVPEELSQFQTNGATPSPHEDGAGDRPPPHVLSQESSPSYPREESAGERSPSHALSQDSSPSHPQEERVRGEEALSSNGNPSSDGHPPTTDRASRITHHESNAPGLPPCNASTLQPCKDSPPHPNPSIQAPCNAPTLQRSNDSTAFQQLASLPAADYDRARKAEAKRLGIRVETLDAEVAKCRQLSDEAAALDSTLSILHSPLVWPQPVDGAQVLDQVSSRFSLYVKLPPGAADALALWDGHSHAFAAFALSPRLNLSSPESGCGKTTTLDLLAAMTPRPLRTESLTAPVLFRLVDQQQPILLLDEVDTFLPQDEELRGLLNAGHKRGGCAYRCEGSGNAVRAFKAFAPAVLSGIGPLPATLHDRSICIHLVKAEENEVTAHFDDLHAEIELELCRKLARWTQDNFAAIQACDPPMPKAAFNRLADNWRPLFAIAQIAGGDWPARALAAFTHLTNPVRTESPPSLTKNFSLQPSAFSLLSDIRQIFTQSAATRISSKQLVDYLEALGSRPWAIRKPINEHWLALRLKTFAIKPSTMRIGAHRAKGYHRSDFDAVF